MKWVVRAMFWCPLPAFTDHPWSCLYCRPVLSRHVDRVSGCSKMQTMEGVLSNPNSQQGPKHKWIQQYTCTCLTARDLPALKESAQR